VPLKELLVLGLLLLLLLLTAPSPCLLYHPDLQCMLILEHTHLLQQELFACFLVHQLRRCVFLLNHLHHRPQLFPKSKPNERNPLLPKLCQRQFSETLSATIYLARGKLFVGCWIDLLFRCLLLLSTTQPIDLLGHELPSHILQLGRHCARKARVLMHRV
jgi:hypothetical protein